MTVRARFAPSPTGELHIGSVRTTLYNYLFAKQNGGALVLRIEDTDQARFDARALPSIYDGLHWLGIGWDEGPREGGPHAPYVQSERLALYQRHANEMVAMGAAYHCFCSSERLAQMRAAQAARKEITKYDRLCRRIDPAQAADRASREPHTVRLKVPEEGSVSIDDLVHGHVEWPLATLDDQVLLKSDGFPTYHLAVVVDDHVMGITHILRGEEWLPSVPKHLLIFRAFGWAAPPMGHVPLVLGQDSKKLSKRHGATRVTEFREQGVLPEGLVNYLALVGWQPGTEEEIFSMDELIARWRVEQVQKAGGKWDYARLRWFSGVWVRRLSDDELLERVAPFIPAEWDRRVVRQTIPHIKERMETLTQAKDLIAFLFTDELPTDPARYLPKKRAAAETRDVLMRVRSGIADLQPFTAPAIEAEMKRIATEAGWKDLNMATRLAVTGTSVGFGVYESVALLGRDRAVARLDRASALLG
ncbi:MAG: glutamate--tRNA ligase [Chloroflexi bacterium]|nr:glutamate--tRNA ligase [Chloroflexota bacterium]